MRWHGGNHIRGRGVIHPAWEIVIMASSTSVSPVGRQIVELACVSCVAYVVGAVTLPPYSVSSGSFGREWIQFSYALC
jgi:hypothetical protein